MLFPHTWTPLFAKQVDALGARKRVHAYIRPVVAGIRSPALMESAG